MILREIENLPRFINGRHNLNNIKYMDYTLLMADLERILLKLLDKVIKESKKKGVTMN